MTSELENSNSGVQRTRRNIMKMGAILGPATLAVPAVLGKASPAAAGELCIFGVCIPLGGGGGRKGGGTGTAS